MKQDWMDLPEIQEKKEEGKIEKQAALYVFRPEGNVTCGMCIFRKDKTKCAILNDKIELYGSCGFYIHGDVDDDNPKMPWIGTVTKLEAGYVENKTGFQCKRCEEWVAIGRSCKKVDKYSAGDTPGEIHPNACCNIWEPDPARSKWDINKLNEFIAKFSK
jgi:hypothetical protein